MTINPPRVDLLSAFEKQELQATIRDGLDDSQALTAITVKSLTSQTVNLETGVVARTEDSDAVNALARRVSAAEVENSGGELELDDRVYLVDQADLTKTELQTVDKIVEGTDVLRVVKFAADPLGMVWQVFARLV